MQRRSLLIALPAAGLMASARAHHGWSRFDLSKPLFLSGTVVSAAWRNPHAELVLAPDPSLSRPADLNERGLPAQTAPVDGAALLKAAQVPAGDGKRWTVELAPLFRMNAWKVAEIRAGDRVELLGFTLADGSEPVLRVEYLWSGGGVYGLRSSPA